MKRQEYVENIIKDARTIEWGIEKLNGKCDRLVCGGKCNGKSCETCPITVGKKALAKKFGTALPKEQTVTINITVEKGGKAVFNFKNTTFRWV